jgi:hypothetical protein
MAEAMEWVISSAPAWLVRWRSDRKRVKGDTFTSLIHSLMIAITKMHWLGIERVAVVMDGGFSLSVFLPSRLDPASMRNFRPAMSRHHIDRSHHHVSFQQETLVKTSLG